MKKILIITGIIAALVILFGLTAYAFAGHDDQENHHQDNHHEENHHQNDGPSCDEPTQPEEPPVIPPVEPPVTPPVEIPPVVEPPVTPSVTPEPENLIIIPTPDQPAPFTQTGGGGAGGSSCFNCQPGTIPPIVNTPNPIVNPIVNQPITICYPIINFRVDTGVPGDGKVKLFWQGDADAKIITYGENPSDLDKQIYTSNDSGFEITGLKKVNYWFEVSNGCSKTPLIDPIP